MSNATVKRAGTYGYPVVLGLTPEQKRAVRRGEQVLAMEGATVRVVVMRGRRFVPRAFKG